MKPSAEISGEFLAQLKKHLVHRQVAHGMELLDSHRDRIASLNPEQKNAGLLTGYVAQWVDLGYQRPVLVKEILSRFSQSSRARLPLLDYLYLRMAQAMVAIAEESRDEALAHIEFVINLENETDDRELMVVAYLWKGRCLRMKGEYDPALTFALKSRDLALELGHKPMAAVARVLESWLYFQKGD